MRVERKLPARSRRSGHSPFCMKAPVAFRSAPAAAFRRYAMSSRAVRHQVPFGPQSSTPVPGLPAQERELWKWLAFPRA